MKTADISKMEIYQGSDTMPSRGDMATMTPRHPPKQMGKHRKSEQAQARAEQARGKRKDHQSKALSYF